VAPADSADPNMQIVSSVLAVCTSKSPADIAVLQIDHFLTYMNHGRINFKLILSQINQQCLIKHLD